jgi:hypothetical protein
MWDGLHIVKHVLNAGATLRVARLSLARPDDAGGPWLPRHVLGHGRARTCKDRRAHQGRASPGHEQWRENGSTVQVKPAFLGSGSTTCGAARRSGNAGGHAISGSQFESCVGPDRNRGRESTVADAAVQRGRINRMRLPTEESARAWPFRARQQWRNGSAHGRQATTDRVELGFSVTVSGDSARPHHLTRTPFGAG